MSRLVSLSGLFLTLAALLLLMFGLQSFEFEIARRGFNPKSIAATGFIVLAAFTLGEFLKQFGAPALLGYIVAGILFGPNLADLLPRVPEAVLSTAVLDELVLINILTIGVIGTLGGGELKIADLKDNWTTIAVVIAFIFIFVVPATAVAVLLAAEFAPTIVPFLADVSMESRVAAALLFAVFGVAMSPTATLAILQETRASGKFTSLVLGIVIVGELELVLLVLIGIAFAEVLLAPGGFEPAALLEAMPAIAAEFGFAILIGVVTGIIFILYLRFVAKEKLLFTVALIFGASYAAQVFHAETLLVFLAAGFVVQNFSKHGHEMIHSLEHISLPVFVIYFMTQAAALDLRAVAGFAAFTVLIASIRAVSIYSASQIAARISRIDASAGRYLWLCFFSLGSVDLVLAALVADAVPAWGTEFQTVIMACVVIHIIAGPPLLKMGLDRAGETQDSEKAEEAEAQSLHQVDAIDLSATESDHTFAEPTVDDEELRERLEELREFFIDTHKHFVLKPIEQRAGRLESALKMLTEATTDGFDSIGDLVSSEEFAGSEAGLEARRHAIRQAHARYRAEVEDIVGLIDTILPCPITASRVDELLGEVRGREPFANVYRARRGAHLFTKAPGDSPAVRILKVLRRIGRTVAGPGSRSVPLGKLWRYYVELSVPLRLERAAETSAEANELFWSRLGMHMRRVDQAFDDAWAFFASDADRLLDLNAEDDPLGAVEEEKTQAHHAGATDHEAVEPDGAEDGTVATSEDTERQSPRARATQFLADRRAASERRGQKLRDALNTWSRTSMQHYTIALKAAFDDFLGAASIAGTLQLPAFRFRPSVRFDSARRAEQRLRERLNRELAIVDGHRGWIILDHQIANFGGWFEAYGNHISETMKSTLTAPIQARFESLEKQLRVRPENSRATDSAEDDTPSAQYVDWKEWLETSVRPQLKATQTMLEGLQADFGRGSGARRHLEVLEARIHGFARSLRLLQEDPESADSESIHTSVISPREWFTSEVARETALRFIELNERVQNLLRVALDTVTEVENVVEFNLLSAHAEAQTGQRSEANETALGGLKRAARMVDETTTQQSRHANELRRWILEEMHEIGARATRPFFDHELEVIERKLSQGAFASFAAQGGNIVSRATKRVITTAVDVWESSIPIVSQTVREIRNWMFEEPLEVGQAELRRTLQPFEAPGELSVPMIYRRIFTPVPLDIPDFYVTREKEEKTLETLIDEWRYGRAHTILIHADSGMGKRSFARHVLHTMVEENDAFEETQVLTLRLDEDTTTLEDVLRTLGDALSSTTIPVDDPIRALQSSERKRVIVFENAQKIFSRSAQGLKLCRAVLRIIHETREEALWILQMNTAAYQWLDISLDFSAYFTHIIELGALTDADLQVVIQKRHRVSGFDIEFHQPSPSILEWLRSPVRTARSTRDPRAAFFNELCRLAKGSPLLALLYWLEAVHVSDEDSATIIAGELPTEKIDLVAPLSLTKQLILSLLVQHTSLTVAQVRNILSRDFEDVQIELEHLERLGYVERSTGQASGTYRLQPFAEALVTPELRRRNMI